MRFISNHRATAILVAASLLAGGCGFAPPKDHVAHHFEIKVRQRSGVDEEMVVWANSTKETTDADLALLAASRKDISNLWLQEGRITSATLAAIREMPRLRDLYIDDVDLGQSELEIIASCPLLEFVSLDRCSLNECDVMPLAKLPNLRELYLIGVQAKRESVDALLRAKPNLQLLFLPLSSAEEVAEVRRLHRLGAAIVVTRGESVGVGEGLWRRKRVEVVVAARFEERWRGAPSDFDGVAKLIRLHAITLEGERWDDHAADVLTQLPGLSTVTLKDTKVSDSALRGLAAMPSVSAIEVRDFWITPERITALESLSPKIKVDKRYSAPEALRAIKKRKP